MRLTTLALCAMLMAASISSPAIAADEEFNWACYFSPISCYFPR